MRYCVCLLRKIIILSVLPLFTAAAYAQAPALDELLSYPGEATLEIPAAVPALVETYPDLEQDRKPARQISNAGGVRLLGGVRFERDPQANTYAWRDLSVEDDKLEEVYFGYRSGGTGHNFLLFTFKDGAKSDGKTVRGFVAEVLPWKKKGEEFEPFTAGISGKYDLVWNVVSWDSFLESSIVKSKLAVDVYPLKVSREEKLRLLDEAVKESTRDYAGEKYHTFFNSCSSNALKVFSRATGHRLVVGRLLPSVVIKHLSLRGFLGARQRHDASNWQP
jgi:hypothetical protein